MGTMIEKAHFLGPTVLLIGFRVSPVGQSKDHWVNSQIKSNTVFKLLQNYLKYIKYIERLLKAEHIIINGKQRNQDSRKTEKAASSSEC